MISSKEEPPKIKSMLSLKSAKAMYADWNKFQPKKHMNAG